MADQINKNKGTTFIYGCQKCHERSTVNSFTAKLEPLEKQINDLSNLIKNEIISQLSGIRIDLEKSWAHNKLFEAETNDKLQKLEMENNSIRKQLNRGDILVNGLPSYISKEDLYVIAESIGKSYEIAISEYDLNMCTWIKKKACVLIKFNNIRKRDDIMKNYRAKYDLKLNQIMSTDIESRVYLSDHYTPMADKLRYACRKKLKSGEIKKFRIQNRDMPTAYVFLNDGKEIKMSLKDVDEYFSK